MIKKPIVYICAPFRASTQYGIEMNITLVREIIYDVAQRRYAPLAPQTMYSVFHGTLTDEIWMGICLRLIECADIMYVLDRDGLTEGMQIEIQRAAELGIPIVRNMADLYLATRAIAEDGK